MQRVHKMVQETLRRSSRQRQAITTAAVAAIKPEPQASPTKKRKREAPSKPTPVLVKKEVTAAVKAEPVAEVVKAPKPRKSKKLDEAEVFPPRVQASTHYVGAHISSAGGVENAVLNALRIGANGFSCFVRPKMQWASKELTDLNKEQFALRAKDHGYAPYVVPHGCYLINLANPDPEKREKSFGAFIDDLQRCEALGVKLYNFHPGSTVGECTKVEGCSFIAEAINRAHKLTSSVVVLIENMAGAGNLVGGTFEELRDIMNQVEDKVRVGVCIDTCHAFAAGYDLRTRLAYEETVERLEATVGTRNVRAMHLNDSKEGLSSHKDRHENLGAGHLGLFPFYALMNDARFAGIPLILETPGGEDEVMHEVWKREVAALYKMQGLSEDMEAEEWEGVHALLSEVQEIRVQSKARAEAKKLAAKRGGGKAKKLVQSDE